MAVTEYKVYRFDSVLAKEGALCAMVREGTAEGTPVSTEPTLKGVGICDYLDNKFILSINNTNYHFYSYGSGASSNASGYVLMMAETTDKTSDVGNAVKTNSTTAITRSASGTISYSEIPGESSVIVSNLEARDQFAIHALRTLMDKMDKDPASVSDNEKMFICEAAYKWAANMMTQASKVRATIKTEEGGGNPTTENATKAIDIDDSDITDASDKLLNNVVAALEKTDIIDRLRGTWKKGDKEISGYYTDKGARNATGYSTINAALAAGWSFKSGGYNEAMEIVHFTEYTDLIKAYNKATSTQETNDEIEPLIDPNEEVTGDVVNKYWSQEAVIKLLRRLQMKKTLTSADDTDEYGAAEGKALYLQRIVNPRQNEMMKDFLKNADPDSDASSVRLKEFLTIYKKFFKHTSTGDEDTQDVIALEEFLTLMKAYVSHTPTEEGDTQSTVGLDDLIKAIKEIEASTTVNIDLTELIAAITAMGNTRTISGEINIANSDINRTVSGVVNIGNEGIGRDNAHPLYISGGGFPNKSSLAASITGDLLDSVVSFNASGAVGYTLKSELKNAVLGFLSSYSDINALYAALQPSIDNRIKAWLQAAKVNVGGIEYPITVNTPT